MPCDNAIRAGSLEPVGVVVASRHHRPGAAGHPRRARPRFALRYGGPTRPLAQTLMSTSSASKANAVAPVPSPATVRGRRHRRGGSGRRPALVLSTTDRRALDRSGLLGILRREWPDLDLIVEPEGRDSRSRGPRTVQPHARPLAPRGPFRLRSRRAGPIRPAAPTLPRRPSDFVRRLRDQLAELTRELRLAEQVQRSMLPRSLPCLPEIEIGASLRPIRHVSGDFYNVFRIDHERVGIYLGDVMGHGPAAALLSVLVMQLLRPKRIEEDRYEILPPSEVLSALNGELLEADMAGPPFVTMVYGVLDVARRTWTYGLGGHPPPILLRRDQPPTRLGGGSPLLGVFETPFT